MRFLNRLRWLSLTFIFSALVFIPFASIYQNYHASHAYDLLNAEEKFLWNSVEFLTAPFIDNPSDLDVIKGTTWTANIFGLKISDPLAVITQAATTKSLFLPFAVTALIPVLIALVFGRVFCGWICPATFIYELNTNFSVLMNKLGLPVSRWQLNKRIKYYILGIGLLLTLVFSFNFLPAFYPPAIVGKELYYAIALDGFSTTALFFLATIAFDTLVSRRGFCRYLCPGGALYSLLGRYRLVRVQRNVSKCNDCNRCDSICEFGLSPMRDSFGQECNNCTACIAICPTNALELKIKTKDQPAQGPGHKGRINRSKIIATDFCNE